MSPRGWLRAKGIRRACLLIPFRLSDAFGHREGDLAIIRAADALEETFRDSDILARLGGDEFAVLASDASIPNREAIVPRTLRSLVISCHLASA